MYEFDVKSCDFMEICSFYQKLYIKGECCVWAPPKPLECHRKYNDSCAWRRGFTLLGQIAVFCGNWCSSSIFTKFRWFAFKTHGIWWISHFWGPGVPTLYKPNLFHLLLRPGIPKSRLSKQKSTDFMEMTNVQWFPSFLWIPQEFTKFYGNNKIHPATLGETIGILQEIQLFL